MRAVRDSLAQAAADVGASRRSAGRLKLMRRSRLPTDSTEACISLTPAATAWPGHIWMNPGRSDQGASPFPTELASFADSAEAASRKEWAALPQPGTDCRPCRRKPPRTPRPPEADGDRDAGAPYPLRTSKR